MILRHKINAIPLYIYSYMSNYGVLAYLPTFHYTSRLYQLYDIIFKKRSLVKHNRDMLMVHKIDDTAHCLLTLMTFLQFRYFVIMLIRKKITPFELSRKNCAPSHQIKLYFVSERSHSSTFMSRNTFIV